MNTDMSVEVVYKDGRIEYRPVNRSMFTRLRRAAKALRIGETAKVKGAEVTRLT
jgi:hypothetical protein